MFEVAAGLLAGHVREDPALLPCFVSAVTALNDGLGRRIRAATLADTSVLLERLDRAHADERRRIARDLHDRLGEGLSVALRQLELHEITNGRGAHQPGPGEPGPRLTRAKEAIVEAMRRLRAVTSGLRQDQVSSLERALVGYLDSTAGVAAGLTGAPAGLRLRVSGDERWASRRVIDETFLILREAIRNALRHAEPQTVAIAVALAPHELHAWVDDDGRGLGHNGVAGPGTGLISMRERAALLGGTLRVDSAPGVGTHVELVVPLTGDRDEPRG